MSKARSVTIQDVARVCGVSPATVSLVLNNSSRRISAETRERVLRTVRETRYQPSALARGLDAKQLRTLGVISGHGGSHYLHYSYYLQTLGGVLDFTQANRLNTLILNERLWEGSLSELRLQIDGRCGGVIIIGNRDVTPLIPALQERGIPSVTVGHPIEGEAISYVDVDNRGGAKEVVRYLISQGHRRIATSRCHLAPFDEQRFEGYCEALTEAGIAFDSSLVAEDPLETHSEAAGRRMAFRFLRTPPDQRPTALFCVSDRTAYGALRVFQKTGVRVPQDVSVAGFDDEYRAALVEPPLTTLRQPCARIGAWAAEHLVKMIEAETPCVQQLFPGELVVRGSVAPPPGVKEGGHS